MKNLLALANYNIANQIDFDGHLVRVKESTYNSTYPDASLAGVGRHQQTHMTITLTSQGVRLYSPPNYDGRSIEGSGWDTWGGLCLSPMKNSKCLIQGHRYIILWHCVGQTSYPMNDTYWTNEVGWGQAPNASPTINHYCIPTTDFQGEMECCYDFTINDTVFKTTGDTVHTGFDANTSYLAYAAFKIGFTYRQTGALGTDLYLSNFRMYDVTNGFKEANFTEIGTLNTAEIIELPYDKLETAQIQRSGDVVTTNLVEY